MECSVCGKQKENLRAVNSKAAKGMRFYACKSCRESGFEPRYLLVLALRSKLPGEAPRFIKEKLYVGDQILAEEVV